MADARGGRRVPGAASRAPSDGRQYCYTGYAYNCDVPATRALQPAPDGRSRHDAPSSPDRSRERRVVLAQALTRLFEYWELAVPERLTLLGLAAGNRMTLQRYAHGEPVAASRDTLDRIGHLFGIQKSLELLYPRNPAIQKGWMTAANRLFHDRRPVDLVEIYGLPGLVMIRGTLDIMRGQ